MVKSLSHPIPEIQIRYLRCFTHRQLTESPMLEHKLKCNGKTIVTAVMNGKLSLSVRLCVNVCICVRDRACECVCMCVSVCMCVIVCERECENVCECMCV